MFLRVFVAAAMFIFAAPSFAQSVLHRGNIVEPGTLDLQKYNLDYEAEILRDLFVGLLTTDASGRQKPGLAESWTVSPDGKTYTFKLRSGLVWSDGVPLTAEDAVFGLRRGLDPKTASNYGNLVYAIVNAPDVLSGKLPVSALGVRAVDALTVEIKLSRPAPVLLILLSNTPMLFPAPKHLIEKVGDGWTKPGVMVSSGPFTLAAWRPGDRVRVVKNPRFYDAKTVALDEVNFYPTVDDSAALNRYRAGELDLNPRFPPNQLGWLQKNLSGEVFVTPALWVTYLIPNHTKAPFNDARVRKALSIAIDRPTLTDKVLRNGEKPYGGVVPDTIPGYVTPRPFDARPREQRIAEAKALLAQAGFGPQKPLKFLFNHRAGLNNRLAAVAITQMWKDIGVQAEILQSDVTVHYNKLRANDFVFADAGWAANPDPEFFLHILLKESESNYGRYDNPKMEAQATAASALADPAARLKAYAAAEAMALDDTALIPLFISAERLIVKPYVKGWTQNPLGQYPSRYIRIEGRK
jgi:oligopeptide transport system substrate-binding protein